MELLVYSIQHLRGYIGNHTPRLRFCFFIHIQKRRSHSHSSWIRIQESEQSWRPLEAQAQNTLSAHSKGKRLPGQSRCSRCGNRLHLLMRGDAEASCKGPGYQKVNKYHRELAGQRSRRQKAPSTNAGSHKYCTSGESLLLYQSETQHAFVWRKRSPGR